MKLLKCNKCGDLVALRTWLKKCECGTCYGKFLMDHRTVLVNDSMFAQVYGVDNSSFAPITYFVQHKHCDLFDRIQYFEKEEEIELIKRKWKETEWADGGIPKLMKLIGAENEDEIDLKLKAFEAKCKLAEELRWDILQAKESL